MGQSRRGEVSFGRFFILPLPDSSLVPLVCFLSVFSFFLSITRPPHCGHRHATPVPLSRLEPGSGTDKEGASHTHTHTHNMGSVFTDGWMDFFGML